MMYYVQMYYTAGIKPFTRKLCFPIPERHEVIQYFSIYEIMLAVFRLQTIPRTNLKHPVDGLLCSNPYILIHK